MRDLFDAHKLHFQNTFPMPYANRMEALDKLETMLLDNEQALIAAVNADFGQRVAQETQLLELMPLLREIRHSKRHLKRWMRASKVLTDWLFWPSRARVMYQPLGVVGIMGAWNYPISLTLTPLANALAAGNAAMIKPSELAPATSALLAQLIAQTFHPAQVSVVEGDAQIAAAFSALPFDHLIFTGSGRIGKKVMAAAAQNLTPVTLELGGKSPAIIQKDFSIEQAAQRIISAKMWNAGQTCIAPDYVWLHASQKNTFIEAALATMQTRWGDVTQSADYSHMINEAAWQRMSDLVASAVAQGARAHAVPATPSTEANHRHVFAPVLLTDVTEEMRVMSDEIFGPILPIMTYEAFDEVLTYVNGHDKPLSLYYFDDNARRAEQVLSRTHAGGAVVNDCMFHYAQSNLPFGGVGGSGMGAYHGHAGFLRFSASKAVLLQSSIAAKVLNRLIKPPYTKWTNRLIRFLFKSRF